jgi:hypothetical protein
MSGRTGPRRSRSFPRSRSATSGTRAPTRARSCGDCSGSGSRSRADHLGQGPLLGRALLVPLGHEPCVVVRRPEGAHLFIGERDQSTIWRAPSPKRIGGGSKETKEDHPTRSRSSCLRSRSATTSARARRCTSRSRVPARRSWRPRRSAGAATRWRSTPGSTSGRDRALAELHRPEGRARSMGRRGPAPTPTKVKRLRGETRPSRLNATSRCPRPTCRRCRPIWIPRPRWSGDGCCGTWATRG